MTLESPAKPKKRLGEAPPLSTIEAEYVERRLDVDDQRPLTPCLHEFVAPVSTYNEAKSA